MYLKKFVFLMLFASSVSVSNAAEMSIQDGKMDMSYIGTEQRVVFTYVDKFGLKNFPMSFNEADLIQLEAALLKYKKWVKTSKENNIVGVEKDLAKIITTGGPLYAENQKLGVRNIRTVIHMKFVGNEKKADYEIQLNSMAGNCSENDQTITTTCMQDEDTTWNSKNIDSVLNLIKKLPKLKQESSKVNLLD